LRDMSIELRKAKAERGSLVFETRFSQPDTLSA
jgi:hypothetical protein